MLRNRMTQILVCALALVCGAVFILWILTPVETRVPIRLPPILQQSKAWAER